jgi:hypothetical protein
MGERVRERMRPTNGKFTLPDLTKKTVKQLVDVDKGDWTSAPTGSAQWTTTWKDTLPEEYRALPDAFQFHSINDEIYNASVGMPLVSISRDPDSYPFVMAVPTFQRQLIMEAHNSFKNFSKNITNKLKKKDPNVYQNEVEDLRVGMSNEVSEIFLDVDKCAEVLGIPGVLGESLKPSIHRTVMARNRGVFNQNEVLTGNIIIRGYSPSYDIGFAIDSQVGMHLNTELWYILKPISIMDIHNKKYQSDLIDAHEQYIQRPLEEEFDPTLETGAEEEELELERKSGKSSNMMEEYGQLSEQSKKEQPSKSRASSSKGILKSAAESRKTTKKLKVFFEPEQKGFPASYQTCLMLVPYCSADHIPPKKISIEEAEEYAKKGQQPPLDSPSYIEYLKNDRGNLARDKNGQPKWKLRCGAVYYVGFLLQPSFCNNRNDNESITNSLNRVSRFDCSGRTKAYVPTDIDVAQRNNVMEVFFNPTRSLMY